MCQVLAGGGHALAVSFQAGALGQTGTRTAARIAANVIGRLQPRS